MDPGQLPDPERLCLGYLNLSASHLGKRGLKSSEQMSLLCSSLDSHLSADPEIN